jgi:exodeoxyribonuclease X
MIEGARAPLIRCIDFETTGVPEPDVPQAVCEIGWTDVTINLDAPPSIGETFACITRPGRPMPPEAQAVHHISDAMIEKYGVVGTTVLIPIMSNPRPNFFCAHVAVRFWPDAPGHSLQVLRYYLGLDADDTRASPPHRAGPDAYVGALLLQRILDVGKQNIETMVRWSKGPALLPRLNFGMHRGAKWEEVPFSYLEWIVDKSDLDRDVKANARHWMKIRKPAAKGVPF